MGEIRRKPYRDPETGEAREGRIWWIRYYRNGTRHEESSQSDKKHVAERLLRLREGDVAKGLPVSAALARFTFDDAAADVLIDYQINGKRSIVVVRRRIEKHLTPFFGGYRMSAITTADVQRFVAERQAPTTRADGSTKPGASNGEINRELTILKRAYSLALRAGKVLQRPYIALLREDNVRQGFLSSEQVRDVVAALPEALKPVVLFAYITGWRIPSEVLTLEWRQIDFAAEEIRLEPAMTKNRKGRVFPFSPELCAILEAQRDQAKVVMKAGHLVPWVFFRMVADGRGGLKAPQPITSFLKAFKAACVTAGCPGRIPHDLRRSAIRNMVRAGISESVAMKLSGHLTSSVFRRYDITSGTDLREAVARVSDAHRVHLGSIVPKPGSLRGGNR